MPLYARNERPSTFSWIGTLNAVQAIEQCREFGLEPSSTLEGNRAILRIYVRDCRESQPASPSGLPEAQLNQSLLDLDNGTLEALHRFPGPQHIPERTHTSPLQPPTHSTPTQRSVPEASCAQIPDRIIEQMRVLTAEAVCQATQSIAQLQLGKAQPDNNVPGFMRDMIRDLPKCDGTSASIAVAFLKGVSKLISLNLAQERAVFLNVTPQTLEPFRQFWVETVANSHSWEHVLRRFREFFLTPEKLRLTKHELLYRPQKHAEKLADYVSDLEANFQILSPQSSHEEIFQTIFCRLNAETRNCLTGLNVLKTTKDLIQASPIVESIRELSVQSQSPNHSQYASPAYPRQVSAGRDSVNWQRNNGGRRNSYRHGQHNTRAYDQAWHARGSNQPQQTNMSPPGPLPPPHMYGPQQWQAPQQLVFPFPPPSVGQTPNQQPQQRTTSYQNLN